MLVHLLCRETKQRIIVGKLVGVAPGEFPFWRAKLAEGELGRKVLRFLADHLGKEVSVLTEHAVDAMDDLSDYRSVDAEYGDPLF